MRVQLLGVRGSTPAPGREFARYGGNTSCVAIGADGEQPTLVLDAGTGIRRPARPARRAPFQGSIMLTHLHWDHTQGLPFCPSIDHDDAEVDLWMPTQTGPMARRNPLDLLARAMSPPHFPIGPAGLRGRWTFLPLDAGDHTVEGVPGHRGRDPAQGWTHVRLPHHRRQDDHRLHARPRSDRARRGTRRLGELHPAAVALAVDVDLLLHDAQHTVEEFPSRAHFGHCPADYAMSLGPGRECGDGRAVPPRPRANR